MKDVNDPEFWDDAKKAAEELTKILDKKKEPEDPCDEDFMEEISS
jgi:hypothetical protein